MNGIDVGILLVVLISSLMGLFRGLVQEVMSLVSWGGSGLGTFFCLPLARHICRQHIQNPLLADGVTAVGLFVVFLILFSLLSHFLSHVVRQSSLGGVNRSLGAAFGILRGVVFICIVEIVMSSFVERSHHPEAVKNGRFSSMIYQVSDILFQALPASAQNFVRSANQASTIDIAPLKAVASPMADVATELLQQQARQEVVKAPTVKPQSEDEIKKLQAQKQAEDLSNLKAKVQEDTNPSNYSKKQRSDMDRLLRQE